MLNNNNFVDVVVVVVVVLKQNFRRKTLKKIRCFFKSAPHGGLRNHQNNPFPSVFKVEVDARSKGPARINLPFARHF